MVRRSTREREQPKVLSIDFSPASAPIIELNSPATEASKSTRSKRGQRARGNLSAKTVARKAKVDPLVESQELSSTSILASNYEADKGRSNVKAKRKSNGQAPAPLISGKLAATFEGKSCNVQVIVGGQVYQPTSQNNGTSLINGAGTDGLIVKAAPTFLGQDGNLYYCVICNGFGDVVCCDGCPNVYHPKCVPTGSSSRIALENDEEPWYCPDCIDKKDTAKTTNTVKCGRSERSPRRAIKHRCCECRQTRPNLSLKPCKVCGVHLHHPSCRSNAGSSSDTAVAQPFMCSSCRAEDALKQEEIVRHKNWKQKGALCSGLITDENVGCIPAEANISINKTLACQGRARNRFIDETESTHPTERAKTDSMKVGETVDRVKSSVALKRKRTPSESVDAGDNGDGHNDGGGGETPKSGKMKKKNKKNKLKRDSDDHLPRMMEAPMAVSTAVQDKSPPMGMSGEMSPLSTSLQNGPPTSATPAFHFYLVEQRPKVEKILTRKHRYFAQLTKGSERNALIAKETAKQWIKLSAVDQKKYINMSMHDYESRIIAWKEEKNIRNMLAVENEGGDAPNKETYHANEERLDDSVITCQAHDRLYNGTSVGSKPHKSDPSESHNRVLLDLLRDVRFHPLPMLSAIRTKAEMKGVEPSSKMVIKHFDVHGPIATSVGDECLGCTRGWPHFCPVLQRRLPATLQRSKLQPAASALLSSRVGLGLRPRRERTIEPQEGDGSSDGKSPKGHLLHWRETPESQDFKTVRFVLSDSLTDPCNRGDDVVDFIEQVAAMKIPEPPKPPFTLKAEATPKKAHLARGLPTRFKRSTDSLSPEGENHAEEHFNKCGRCRTIIMNDKGCIQCRRAQLVINMSRKPTPPNLGEGEQKINKERLLKVQTAMLCRVVTKESVIGESQIEGDQKIAKALLRERWMPSAVLPPTPILVPSPLRRPNKTATQEKLETETDPESTPGKPMIVDARDNEKEEESSTGGTAEVYSELRPRTGKRCTKAPEALDHQEADRQTTEKRFREEIAVVSKRALTISCSSILLALMRRDPFFLFAQPVAAKGYLAVVKDPIDFSKIRDKVRKGEYQRLNAFIEDVRLLCDNAFLFNPPDSIYWKTAKEISDVLIVMQRRASKWMSAIKHAHMSFSRRATTNQQIEGKAGDCEQTKWTNNDPFEELRKVWPEAVDMYEDNDWLKMLFTADFRRTKENEIAYYGSLVVRRAAKAAEMSLATYPDQRGTFSAVVKRSFKEDEDLRDAVDSKVARVVGAGQLHEIVSGREEGIVRLLRRVQNRRLERRIGSENGCARCDGMGLDHELKAVMNADARCGRNKRQGDGDMDGRVAAPRLDLTTGLASANIRDGIEKRREQSGAGTYESVQSCVSLKGSRVHGLGLFSEQHFKKGEVVVEYIGECVSLPVTEAREKKYNSMRIQDYQLRINDSQIIDATVKGGLGRYVNHSCNPNCVTKIVQPPNEPLKRVFIVALRDIEPREELSYDYQFPLETDMAARIPCNCGSDVCRGFMNWDLPEKGANTGAIRTQKRGANMRGKIVFDSFYRLFHR